LAGRFQTIVGHGDYAASKPAPDPFLKAAELLGVEPALCWASGGFAQRGPIRVVSRDDDDNGARPSRPTEEMRGLCTFVACDLHEVRRLIQSL
jgi:hypothetical protein